MKTYMLIIHALINKFHKDTSDIENTGHLLYLFLTVLLWICLIQAVLSLEEVRLLLFLG